MNTLGIYYKDQCSYCLNKGGCSYEKRTKQFIETISGIESLASGVFGCLSFACDYFYLDQAAYIKAKLDEAATEA